MVVNAIYNVVDCIFIGSFAGEEALAGLTIAFPVMMIIFALAILITVLTLAADYRKRENSHKRQIELKWDRI